MIYTVTLNPALDRSIVVEQLLRARAKITWQISRSDLG
jgi:fructose-1-phosphate kinase PfkB-like protein